jgi:hypothetical protein
MAAIAEIPNRSSVKVGAISVSSRSLSMMTV